ncbi:conserved domain protein [Eggerthella sp. HGA1]|nr:conserved domain protein [Eggerthella sp. HGA1]
MSGTRRSRADSTPIQRRFHALSPRFSRASRMCAAGLAGVAKACALHRALQAFRRAEPRRSGVPSSCPAFGRRARLEPFRRRPRVSRGLCGSAFRCFHDLVH